MRTNNAAAIPVITPAIPSGRATSPGQFTAPHPPSDHLFVSNVRFVSMAAVVCIHCLGRFGPLANIAPGGILSAALIQPFKFGTIGFFLISGFLMGEGLTRRKPVEYLQRRIKTVLLPWLVWFSFLVALVVAASAYGHPLMWKPSELLRQVYVVLFSTPYWFVPNLLLATCILLLCGRSRFDLRLGGILLTFSIFYGVNIYQQWLPNQSHTQALFGFVFYLWLGAWAGGNSAQVEEWIYRIPTSALICFNIVAFCAAVFESSVLAVIRPSDLLNTLRLSNQIYAVAMVVMIVKLRCPIWPRQINVRGTTFGVYLAHTIVIIFLSGIFTAIGIQGMLVHNSLRTAIVTAFFLIGSCTLTYGCSLMLTQLLLTSPRLGWMVGSSVLSTSKQPMRCRMESARGNLKPPCPLPLVNRRYPV